MWRQQELSQARVPCPVGMAALSGPSTVLAQGAAMCLDPGTDRLFRVTRPSRDLSSLRARPAAARPTRRAAATLPASAAWVLQTLAGEDDLVSRGWVVLSRQTHA